MTTKVHAKTAGNKSAVATQHRNGKVQTEAQMGMYAVKINNRGDGGMIVELPPGTANLVRGVAAFLECSPAKAVADALAFGCSVEESEIARIVCDAGDGLCKDRDGVHTTANPKTLALARRALGMMHGVSSAA